MRKAQVPTRTIQIVSTIIAIFLTLSPISEAVAGKIYRCVDDKKKVTVSDTPCVTSPPATADADKDKSKSAPADTAKKDDKSGSAQAKKDVKG